MKSKLMFLTKISLKKKIKTKWFLVANIVLCVLIAGLINVDSVIKFFGGDFNEKTEILVIDETNTIYEDFINYYELSSTYLEDMTESTFTSYTKTIDEAKEEIEEDKNKILLVISEDETNFLKANIVTYEGIDAIILQVITASLNTIKSNMALEFYEIDEEKLALIENPITIEKTRLDEGKSNDEMMELVMGVVFPIMILPFFMLTIYLVQMIGAEINEEKTTKSMEIIISNVSPKTHFLAKLLSSNAFVLIQGILLVLYATIGLILRLNLTNGDLLGESADTINSVLESLSQTGFLDSLGFILPIALILMLATFVAYSLIAGILASMTTNMEDYQQLQTPLVIVLLIGYYLSVMASMFEGSIFIRVLSYIPLLSALLSPALLVLGQITFVDVLISIALLFLLIWLLIKYGLKIYKVGILNYSSSGLWKKMFKAIKD